MKVDPVVTIGRCTHAGKVCAYKISGDRQSDTDEVAGPRTYVYEPAGHVDFLSCVGDGRYIVQLSISARLTCLGANDGLLIDTPNPREFYLAWRGENGFGPIGAAA